MDAQQIKYYALLARIGVTDSEAETLANDVSRILTFIDTLKKVAPDDQAIRAIIKNHTDVNHVREDIVAESVAAAAIRAGFPKADKDGMLRVPKIL